jgi:alpha-mannosidase
VVARGQTIPLPTRNDKRVYLLAASADGDRVGRFRVGSMRTEITVLAWRGFTGQWDNRRWSGTFRQGPPDYDFAKDKLGYVPEFVGLDRGFVKQQPVAWFASHQHDRAGKNIPYAYSYLYGYALDIPRGATTLTLPDDKNILLLAATVSDEAAEVTPACPLYGDLQEPAGGLN